MLHLLVAMATLPSLWLPSGAGTFHGALLVDALLVAGFGLQHSLLASLTAKKRVLRWFGLEPLPWRSLESLINVFYILTAASLWRRTDLIVWSLSGWTGWLITTICVLSWLWYFYLHLVEYDCGLAFGSTTLIAHFLKQPVPKLVPWAKGSRRWIRFPVHTAFFGMFFAVPVMTADLLVLAVVLNAYNVLGTVLYDKRLEKTAGQPYREYQQRTGLIWPPIYRAPRGAAGIPMPAPRHWRNPWMHFPGIIAGIVLALLYLTTLSAAMPDAGSALHTLGIALLGAAMTGGMIGLFCSPEGDDWQQSQTDLSTTIALASALGIAIWAFGVWGRTGSPPAFALLLPLFFTGQYLGHVLGVLLHVYKWAPASKTAAGEWRKSL